MYTRISKHKIKLVTPDTCNLQLFMNSKLAFQDYLKKSVKVYITN